MHGRRYRLSFCRTKQRHRRTPSGQGAQRERPCWPSSSRRMERTRRMERMRRMGCRLRVWMCRRRHCLKGCQRPTCQVKQCLARQGKEESNIPQLWRTTAQASRNSSTASRAPPGRRCLPHCSPAARPPRLWRPRSRRLWVPRSWRRPSPRRPRRTRRTRRARRLNSSVSGARRGTRCLRSSLPKPQAPRPLAPPRRGTRSGRPMLPRSSRRGGRPARPSSPRWSWRTPARRTPDRGTPARRSLMSSRARPARPCWRRSGLRPALGPSFRLLGRQRTRPARARSARRPRGSRWPRPRGSCWPRPPSGRGCAWPGNASTRPTPCSDKRLTTSSGISTASVKSVTP
mmetsp:Transcript_69609/g.197266  ORF Transcript_69609/g.197266 Transcript_69609/m.197266 type:complete len:344 (-) Transcript_69609:268-1299(-)